MTIKAILPLLLRLTGKTKPEAKAQFIQALLLANL